jgi:glycosyltransferase involved in cell wall biosynthesis
MKSALIIPTLNEIDGMKTVVSKIKKEWVDEIIIVDGGSTDGTVEEAKKQNLTVVQQTTKGKHGAAIFDGFEYTDADILIMFGGDGNNEVEEIPKILSKTMDGYDQVIVTRFGKSSINEDAGLIDGFGNRFFTFLVNIFFSGNLTDTLSSSRSITRKAWNELKMDDFSMSLVYQMSIRGLIKKQKIIDIIGNERPRIGGVRKMHRISTSLGLLSCLIREFSWKG